ncbi:laccase-5 [Aedes aegypti]|uniref:Multicopper oxidase n=2 Tax=Aedes aegypti TaxID=7159 RepID=A0A913WNI7_AEDAE|nr:laccase-5 [Aedes aegypti]
MNRFLIWAVVITIVLRNTADGFITFSLNSNKLWSNPKSQAINLFNASQEGKSILEQMKTYDGAECDRVCNATETPRICYFSWVAENYAAMGSACKDCRWGNHTDCSHPQCITADGMERPVVSLNRQMPGPAVIVCRNDIIVIDLLNHMEGSSTTIHWHGMHQTQTPWMDGVPMVTQCPIPAGNTFRYVFNASEHGTQFYHSHAGHQKANGHFGLLVVRHPTDLNMNLYDYDLSEHHIIIADWTLDMAEKFVPGLQSHTIQMDSILINGRGRHFDEEEQELQQSPLTVYRVEQWKRYRFRMISSGSQFCPFQLQIEAHRMQIISTDGGAVQPVTVDTVISTSGERYDFVLHADQKPGDYWVRVRAVGFCNIQRKEEFAVLSYRSSSEISDEELAFPVQVPPTWDEPFPDGMTLNHPNSTCYQPGDQFVCASDLEAHEVQRDDALIDAVPDKKFYVAFNTFTADTSLLFSNDGYVRYMTVALTLNNIGITNNISMVYPSFPPLTQPELLPTMENAFCNVSSRPAQCPMERACFCVHRLKVDLNDIVEMSLIDDAEVIRELYHPFHLHGHRFIVTGMGQLPTRIKHSSEKLRWIKDEELKPVVRRTRGMPDGHNPPYKDTVSIPSRGYTKIRFRADNPGFWLVHCHFEWHLGIGMSFILQVGEIDQMIKTPPGFPTCGHYKPEVESIFS